MKEISIQDLKATLSAAIADAESGETLAITRHHEVVAQLGPARPASLHRGRLVGAGALQPALERGSRGRYLAALLDDRGDR